MNINYGKGGAINGYLNPWKMNIINSTFSGNTAKYGGAYYVNSGSDVNRDASQGTVTSCNFYDNNAMYGGGIFSDRHNISVLPVLLGVMKLWSRPVDFIVVTVHRN